MNTARVLIQILADSNGPEILGALPVRQQQRILALAQRERVLPLIGSLLVQADVVPNISPSMAHYLISRGRGVESNLVAAALSYENNVRRTADFLVQLKAIDAVFARAGIPWIPLKGSALLLDSVWPEPAAREMTDIDIIIPDETLLPSAVEVLYGAGYRELPSSVELAKPALEDNHHLCAMAHPDHVGSIELHRSLIPNEHSCICPTEPILERVVSTPKGLRLSPPDFIGHIIVHSRISDWTLRTARMSLRSVLDVGYCLQANPGIGEQVRELEGPSQYRRAVQAHLAAVDAVFGFGMGMPYDSRLWWMWSCFISSDPRRSWMWECVGMLPVYVRKDRMEGRVGKPLKGPARLATTAKFTYQRIKQAIEEARTL